MWFEIFDIVLELSFQHLDLAVVLADLTNDAQFVVEPGSIFFFADVITVSPVLNWGGGW